MEEWRIRQQIEKQDPLGSWKPANTSEFKDSMLYAYKNWKVHEYNSRDGTDRTCVYFMIDKDGDLVILARTLTQICVSDKHELWMPNAE